MPIRRMFAATLALALLAGAALAAKSPKAQPAPAAVASKSLIDGIEIYNVGATHSQVEFIVRWMGISKVHGTFQDFRGTLCYDSTDVKRSSVTVLMRAATINTNHERRDKDLKSPDFFDVEKFPFITFSSREIAHDGDRYILRGPLTIHGVTRDVEIPFHFLGKIKDAAGDDRVGFEGGLTINRKDYGIVGPPRFNLLLEKGLVISEEVEIPLAVEGWKQAPRDTMRDPVADSLYRAILKRGVPAVAKQYREARAQMPDSLMRVNEGMLNAVAYQLMVTKRTDDAIALFGLEAEAFPAAAFGYAGLGNAYAAAGEREQAVKALEKAVSIEPMATRAMELLKRLRP